MLFCCDFMLLCKREQAKKQTKQTMYIVSRKICLIIVYIKNLIDNQNKSDNLPVVICSIKSYDSTSSFTSDHFEFNVSSVSDADIMVIVTGLDHRHKCWFWKLFSCPVYTQEHPAISTLIQQKKFLTISDEGTLNPAQDKRILQWAYEVW